MIGTYGRAALGVMRRDFLIFTSYRARVVAQLLGMAATVTLFFYVSRLVKTPQFPNPEEYFAFVLVGLMMLRALLISFTGLTMGLRTELVAGTFERLVTSPFGATAGTISMLLFPFALAVFIAVATLLFAAVAFGVPFEWVTVPLAAPVAVLAALSFAPFMLLLAAAVILFKQAAGAVRFFVLAISVLAGFYFPPDLLPGWINWAAEVQPFTPIVELLRHVLVGSPLEGSAWAAVAKPVGFALVLMPLSVVVLRRAIEAGRRRATITEY